MIPTVIIYDRWYGGDRRRAAHAASPSQRMLAPAIETQESVTKGHDFMPLV